jgi:hypothetical protein
MIRIYTLDIINKITYHFYMTISVQGRSTYSTSDYGRFLASANTLSCRKNQYNRAMDTHAISGSVGFISGSSSSVLGLLVFSACFDCGITYSTYLAVGVLGGAAGAVCSNEATRLCVASLKSDVENSTKTLTKTMREAEDNARRSVAETFGYLNRVFTIDTSQIMVSPR